MHCQAIRLPLLLWWCAAASTALAMDHAVFRDGSELRRVSGRVVVKAQDGGVLLMARDGALWNIEPQHLVRLESDADAFQPLARDELAAAVLAELPVGFEVHHTNHFLVAHNTSRAYAQWCGALFERLYAAFDNFWSRRGFDLQRPELPLVAVVFADRQGFETHARRELGDAAAAVIGYYSLRSNRMWMYDLTGVAGLRQPGDRRASAAQINAMLSRPEAARTVATVVHECTHQIAFNTGLQTRYADIPVWVSEGIAMYFETPDLQSSRGWRTIGAVNPMRLEGFRATAARHRPEDLEALIVDDQRFRDTRTAAQAYCEAWALTYFLVRHKPAQWEAYVRRLSQKTPLVWNTPQQRRAEFVEAFGDLATLHVEFVRYMRSVR